MKEWLDNTSQAFAGGAIVIVLIMLGVNLATWGAAIVYGVMWLVFMVASVIVESRKDGYRD